MPDGAVILVEGDSDRIALEALAARLGGDRAAADINIVSMGGVTNLSAYLERFAASRVLVVLCDERESPQVRRAVARAGMTHVHIEVCVADLEDELIRALGAAGVEQVVEAAGDLGSFRALQQMPEHREHTTEQQLHRFVGTKSGRKAKYARLLVEALDRAREPGPLTAALVAASEAPGAKRPPFDRSQYDAKAGNTRALVVALQGTRISLRELTTDDLEAVVAYSIDEVVALYQDWPSHTADAAKAFLDREIDAAKQTPRISYSLAIVEHATSLMIGDASIGIKSFPNKRAEIGFTLRRDRWGCGFATEASRLLLAFGFDQLGMHRIEATTHPENEASRRVLEKLGMSYEGRIRDHLFVNGAWRDSLAFSILESEWRAQASA